MVLVLPQELGMETSEKDSLVHQNRLLHALSPAMRTQLLPLLEPFPLTVRDVLIAQDVPICHVYFPLHGMVSLISTLADGTQVEVMTIGKEGLVGLPLFLRATRSPFTAFVQVPGEALRIAAVVFERLLDEVNSDLNQRLYRYTHVLFNQIGQLVVCNRLHLIAQRCACWLLLTHDRMGRDDFLLTHDFLAQMLGVRRASVTEVAGRLQQAGLIRYRRGVIQVLDRAGLEAACCECYGVMQQQYDQLLGPA